MREDNYPSMGACEAKTGEAQHGSRKRMRPMKGITTLSSVWCLSAGRRTEMKQSLRVLVVVLLLSILAVAGKKRELEVIAVDHGLVEGEFYQTQAWANTTCFGSLRWASCFTMMYPSRTAVVRHYLQVVKGSDGQIYNLQRTARYTFDSTVELVDGETYHAFIVPRQGGYYAARMYMTVILDSGEKKRAGYDIVGCNSTMTTSADGTCGIESRAHAGSQPAPSAASSQRQPVDCSAELAFSAEGPAAGCEPK